MPNFTPPPWSHPFVLSWCASTAGCAVVSDDKLDLWLDPDRDGHTLATDCDNTDPRVGGPEDPSDQIDNDCDGIVEVGDAAALDTYTGEPGSRTAARIAVVDGASGVLIGPDSAGSGNKVVWLEVTDDGFIEHAVWNVDIEGDLGHPKGAIAQEFGTDGKPLVALAFPDARVDGREQAGCVVLLADDKVTGEHTLTVDDCTINGPEAYARAGADIAMGRTTTQQGGILVGFPGMSEATVYTVSPESGGHRVERGSSIFGNEGEGIGEAVAWLNQTDPIADGPPMWAVGLPGASGGNGEVRMYLADTEADHTELHKWTWIGENSEQLGRFVGTAPAFDDTRSLLKVESLSRAMIVALRDTGTGEAPASIDDAAILTFKGIQPLGTHVPFLAEMPDGIGTPADPIYWTALTAQPVDGAPCAGSASATWLVPVELEGEWTPADADKAVCLNEDLESGVLTAVVSRGAEANLDNLVIGRPSAHSGGGKADLFTGLDWP